MPWVALLRGREMKRMRPWLEGPRARPWFRRLMSGADALIVPSDSALDTWRSWLPEAKGRMFRVYPYLKQPVEREEPRVEVRAPIRVSLAGSGRPRPELGVFRSVLEAFAHRCPELRGSLVISSAGAFGAADLSWASRVGLTLLSNKKERGELNVVVDDASQSLGLPAGLFTAMSSGAPVLSVGRNQEAGRLLAHTGLGLHVDCAQHGWAERGAGVFQRAVFRRALRRGLLAEYAPRPAAIAQLSAQRYCDQVERICREVLSRPKSLAPAQVDSQFGHAHALEQSLGE